MPINGRPLKQQQVMNKKEIAQQYARQTLEQEASAKSEQSSGKQDEPQDAAQESMNSIKEYEQMQFLLKAIQMLYNGAMDSYQKVTKGKEVEKSLYKLRELSVTATNTASHLNTIAAGAERLAKVQNKIGSRWVTRLYLIAILSGIFSALSTLVIVWLLWN